MRVVQLRPDEVAELARLKGAADDLYARYSEARNAHDRFLNELAVQHATPDENEFEHDKAGFFVYGRGGAYMTIARRR